MKSICFYVISCQVLWQQGCSFESLAYYTTVITFINSQTKIYKDINVLLRCVFETWPSWLCTVYSSLLPLEMFVSPSVCGKSLSRLASVSICLFWLQYVLNSPSRISFICIHKFQLASSDSKNKFTFHFHSPEKVSAAYKLILITLELHFCW